MEAVAINHGLCRIVEPALGSEVTHAAWPNLVRALAQSHVFGMPAFGDATL